jgi:hypothetical protein
MVGDELTTRAPLDGFSRDREDRQIPVFRALREVGLITSKVVPEEDYNFNEIEGRGYTFFHDRYAEFELASVYTGSSLGRIDRDVASDTATLSQIVATIEQLLRRALNFPVLSGALDHWFEMNFNARENKGDVAVLLPLFNLMSLSESGSVRSKASMVLAGFASRGTASPSGVFREVLASGERSLQIDLATAMVSLRRTLR